MEGSALDWLDEIDLDPSSHWRSMGIRALGSRPWLVADEKRSAELAIKADLLTERHHEVFAAGPESDEAARETRDLVEAECARLGLDLVGPIGSVGGSPDGLHALDLAGRLIQEDLCLMQPTAAGWVLAAASLCFPSRWRLADKLGRNQAAVHGPVDGYGANLAPRVDRMFDRLGDRIVWRRNWFVHPDPQLFQPDRPVDGDPVIEGSRCGAELFLRSERQTLRRLPATGWILFTIRTQQEPLATFLADGRRRERFARYLAEATQDQLDHRGIGGAQAAELTVAIGA